jgi:hypothetical protein
MSCPFCEWELGHGGCLDPCDILIAFDDHITEHAGELLAEIAQI